MQPIRDDKEYNKCLERLVNGAEYLDDPLLSEVDYQRGMKLYNELEKRILQYRLSER